MKQEPDSRRAATADAREGIPVLQGREDVNDRIPLGQLTSEALDALYEQLEAAEDTEAQRQLATAREALASASSRAARANQARAEAQRDRDQHAAVLREVLAEFRIPTTLGGEACVRTYNVPASRVEQWRSVVAPTVERPWWEQLADLRKRADQLEESLSIAHDTSNRSEAERARAVQRAEQAEAERDTARQHAAAIAAQRDRLRQRMNNLADRWERDAPPPGNQPLTELRAEISVAPFDPEGAMTIQEYTKRGRRLWAFRCWGTETCDGWLGLGHHTQSSALIERERHVAEEHAAPEPDGAEQPAAPAEVEERAAQLADLAREILYATHNISSHDWARWRETLDTITDQEQQ